jgi:hypothetical protein
MRVTRFALTSDDFDFLNAKPATRNAQLDFCVFRIPHSEFRIRKTLLSPPFGLSSGSKTVNSVDSVREKRA